MNPRGSPADELVPGDPDALRSLSSSLRRIATGLAQCQASVGRLHTAGWTGPAAHTLAERLTSLQRPYAVGAAAVGLAAAVTARHAEVMSRARAAVARASADAREAEERTARWQAAWDEHRRVQLLAAAAGPEYQRLLTTTARPPAEDPGREARAHAERLVREAVEEVRRSGRHSAVQLRHAAARAPREPQCVDVLGTTSATTPPIAAARSSGPSPGHTVLDVLGLIPGLGAIADLPNAIWYGLDHDWLSAGLTAAAALPFFGDLAGGGRLVATAGRVVQHEAVATTALAGRRGVPLGFRDAEAFTAFAEELSRGLREAGYADAEPVLQGSAVTGRRFVDGRPFDESRRSDLDIALGSATLLQRARELGIGLRSAGSRSAPLTGGDVSALGLEALVARLTAQVQRPVRFMIYDSAQAALARRPGIRVR